MSVSKDEKVKVKNKLSVKMGVIMVLTVFILFFLMILSMISVVKNEIIKSTYQLQRELTDRAAGEIKNWVGKYVSELEIFSKADINEDGDIESIAEWFKDHKQYIDEDFKDVIFFDSFGNTYGENGRYKSENDITKTDFFKAVVKDKLKKYVGSMFNHPQLGTVIPIVRGVKDSNGNVVGGYLGMLPFSTINYSVLSTKIGETGFFYWLDKKGQVAELGDGTDEFAKAILNCPEYDEILYSNNDIDFSLPFESGTYHVFVTNMIGVNSVLLFAIDEAEVLAPLSYITMVTIVFEIIIGVLVLLVFTICLNKIFRKIYKIKNLILNLSSGEADLTVQLPIKHNDEMDTLVKAVNFFIVKLRSIMSNIKESENELNINATSLTKEIDYSNEAALNMSGSIKVINNQVLKQADCVNDSAAAVTEITRNIDSLDNMISTQASSVTEASAAVEEMVGNIKQVNVNIAKMSDDFDVLADDSKEGISKNAEVNKLIEQIALKSTTMIDANAIIQNIASQTNLLAMNAAIEAAHAGDAGRGFSVVSDEIRKLAESSSEQSSNISKELDAIQEGISKVLQESNASQAIFGKVSQKIEVTGTLVSQIKSAMDEQQVGSEQILEALHLMNDSTSEVRSSAQEMKEGNSLIMNGITTLQDSTKEITTAMSLISDQANVVQTSCENVENITSSFTDSISAVNNDINRFKV